MAIHLYTYQGAIMANIKAASSSIGAHRRALSTSSHAKSGYTAAMNRPACLVKAAPCANHAAEKDIFPPRGCRGRPARKSRA